jgi:tetratricopeptide (TPR) repeat protein
MAEAVVQLRRGLDVLTSLTESLSNRQQELDLLSALGGALTATKGWSEAEVGEILARARALAEQLDRPEYLVSLIPNQWAFHCVRAEHRLALPLGQQLEQIGEARNDTTVQLMGRLTHGLTRFFLGEFVTARALLERNTLLANPVHRNIRGLSFDPYVANAAFLATTLAHLGYIDQARSRIDEALSEAYRLKHAHSLAFALDHANRIDWSTSSLMVRSEEFLALSTERGFPFFLGLAQAYRGRSLLGHGRTREGLALLTQGRTELRSCGAVNNIPMVLTWLAEAYATLRQSADERNCLAEAAQIVDVTEERFLEAELQRVSGDLLKAADDQPGAERHYRQAIAVAERQSARLFQLRASVSLARLWRNQGKHAEARDQLGPVYNWFTEGFDAPDLKDAKSLLDELA